MECVHALPPLIAPELPVSLYLDRWHLGSILRQLQFVQNGDVDGSSSDGSLAEERQLEPEEAAGLAEPMVTPVPREVYVVDSLPKAQIALQRLQAIHAADPETIFACDTEVRLALPLHTSRLLPLAAGAWLLP